MRILLTPIFLIASVAAAIPATSAEKQISAEVAVQSPRPGEAVQGVVPVIGNTDIDGFQSYELAFAFAEDATETWFPIHSSTQPVANDLLGEWNTTTLTDGTYSIRMRVEISEGEAITILVEGLRVRNYSPIETDTPAPTATPDPGEPATPTLTPIPPTPTAFPSNPVELPASRISASLLGGVLGAAALMGLLALYRIMRRK